MLEFVNKYGLNVHSQNSEDGIIQECLRRLDITSGRAVEIGANDGHWMSNTRLLLENGWSGAFVEASWPLYLKCKENWSHRKDVKCICSKVDGRNVNAFVDDSCDVLSVDTDGSDFEIFKGLKAKPKIVIVEIDSSIPPDVDGFNSDGGSGYLPMLRLGREKGYFLLAHTGNLIFVRSEYWASHFPDVWAHPEMDVDLIFNRSWLKAA